MRLVRGDLLSYGEQQQALALYVQRFTCEHVPTWARVIAPGGYYAPQYASDREWLERTEFPVKKDGTLDRRAKRIYSRSPTWPCGQWLAAPYQKGTPARG